MPAKSSMPGRLGTAGADSGPAARISTRASIGPCEVSSLQRPSSHAAPVTSHPKRSLSRTPKRSAHDLRYARISACGEYVRDHDGFGANENEYRCDGTSQRHPG